jgi:hypothetical protein
MDTIDNPKEEMMHRSSSPYLEPVRVSMMIFDLILGEFTGAPNRPPGIDPFLPWLSFLELASELSASRYTEYLCFVLPSCLDGNHH